MIKVKFFEQELPEGGELSNKINVFIEENNYEVVDIEISTILTAMNSHMLIACVTYKE